MEARRRFPFAYQGELPQEQERFLSLLAREVNGNLTIEVKNSFDGVVEMQDGRFASRKEEIGHGLGLEMQISSKR